MHPYAEEIVDALELDPKGRALIPAQSLERARRRIPTMVDLAVGELGEIVTSWVQLSQFLEARGSSGDARALHELAEAVARLGNTALYARSARARPTRQAVAQPPPSDPRLSAELTAMRRRTQHVRG